MNSYTCETVHNIPEPILEVCSAYCFASKNIYNSTLYLIKSIVESYDFIDKKFYQKTNIKNDNLMVLQYFNTAVSLLNNKTINKNKDNEKSNNPLKLYKNYDTEIDKNTFYQFLNSTLLINAIKIKESKTQYKDCSEVSSHLSQSVVRQVIQDYKNYISSLKAYYKTPANFKSKPKSPQNLLNLKKKPLVFLIQWI